MATMDEWLARPNSWRLNMDTVPATVFRHNPYETEVLTVRSAPALATSLLP
jgi:hypothetical protein